MSALPVAELEETRPTIVVERPRPRVGQPRPTPPPATPKPRVEVRPRIVVRRGESPFDRFAKRAVLFACVVSLVSSASSLAGQVMLERARGERNRARVRTAITRRAETALRAHLDELTRPAAIEEWATAHGFVAPDAPAGPATKGGGLVALNR